MNARHRTSGNSRPCRFACVFGFNVSVPGKTADMVLPQGRGIILFTTALITRGRPTAAITNALFHAGGMNGTTATKGSRRTMHRGVLGKTGVVTYSKCAGSRRGPSFLLSNGASAG